MVHLSPSQKHKITPPADSRKVAPCWQRAYPLLTCVGAHVCWQEEDLGQRTDRGDIWHVALPIQSSAKNASSKRSTPLSGYVTYL